MELYFAGLREEHNPSSVRFAYVSLDSETFRSRATHCREVGNGTKEIEAQRARRDLATNLDGEANKIDGQEMVRVRPTIGEA